MTAILHIADTVTDFLEVADIWPEELGSFYEHNGAQARVADAIRAGTLLGLRDEETQTLLAAVAIDLLTYAPHMFIPFVLVRGNLSNDLSIRRQINTQILRLAMIRGVGRIMFHMTKNETYIKTIAGLNDLLAKSTAKISVEINGEVEDLYGDGRTISTVSLFIQPEERPDLIGNVVNRSKEFYKAVLEYGKKEALAAIVGGAEPKSGGAPTALARISTGGVTGGFGGMQAACCSGCNEDNKTDKSGSKDGKEAGKDGKDSKDGKDGGGKDGVELSKVSPEKHSVDSTGIFTDYATLGVQKFDRADRDFPFLPLA